MQRTKALAISGALMVAGCSSGEGSQLDTVAPSSATVGPLPTLPESSPTTTAPTPAATLPDGVIGLSAGGPWTLVDSAPGVTTPGLVYELMPGLWVYLPVVEDIANGITWTLNEEDRPIIEAYLQARLVYYLAESSDPMDFSSSSWAEFYVDGGSELKAQLSPLGADGQVTDMSGGVVLRPTVGGDGRTVSDALVLDCVLDGAVRRNNDGSIAEGSTPGIVQSDIGATIRVVAGLWKLNGIRGGVAAACG